jgi:hypothetical protein
MWGLISISMRCGCKRLKTAARDGEKERTAALICSPMLPSLLSTTPHRHQPFGLDHHHLTFSLHPYLNHIFTLFETGAP